MSKTKKASSRPVWRYVRFRSRRCRLGAAVVAYGLLGAFATPALAQTPVPPAEAPNCVTSSNDRVLNGHTLLWPQYVDSSVVTTYAGSRTSLVVLSVPDLPTRVGARTLDLIGVGEAFDFGFKILDPWAVQLTAGGRGIVGSNTPALLYQTGVYDFGGTLATTIRLLRSESFQLSIRPFGSYSTGRVASFIPLLTSGVVPTVNAILDGNTGEYFSTPLRSYAYGIGAAVAWAIHPIFSLQGSASVAGRGVHIEPFDGTQRNTLTNTGVEYRFGVAAEVDFKPVGAPVAALAEYLASRESNSSGIVASTDFDTSHTLALGVYYTGQPQLQFGGIVATQLGLAPIASEVGESNTPRRTTIWIVVRHGW